MKLVYRQKFKLQQNNFNLELTQKLNEKQIFLS